MLNLEQEDVAGEVSVRVTGVSAPADASLVSRRVRWHLYRVHQHDIASINYS